MSFFSESNQDAYTGSTSSASFGPRLGFQEAFEASYEAQQRGMSVFGLEFAFRQREQEQIRAMREAGVSPHRSLNDVEGDNEFSPFTNARPYYDAAKQIVDGGSMEEAGRIANADAEIMKLQQEHPTLNLKTYREMFGEVADRAKKAERRYDQSETSFGGAIGGFLGGAAAGIDPRTDPANTLTLGVGGFGKGVATRIATEAGAQGAIETVNQVTGVQDSRRLLGLDYGLSSAVGAIAGAAVGGAVIQGAGEALVGGARWAGRRWFRDLPNDPAPAPPVKPVREGQVLGAPEQTVFPETPIVERVDVLHDFDAFMDVVGQPKVYGEARAARQRTAVDLDYVTQQLDDFAGPRPWEVRPPTETAAAPFPTHMTYDRPYQKVVDNLDTVDDVARRIDPDTFRTYDKLETQATTVRGWLSDLDEQRMDRAQTGVADIEAQIADLNRKLEKASPKNRSRLESQINDLQRERSGRFDALSSADTPDQARLRERLAELDAQQRDLAPLVSRAYSAAKGEWRSQALDIDALRFLKTREQGAFRFRPDAPEARPVVERPIGTTVDLRDAMGAPAARAPLAATPTVVDRVPLLQRGADIMDAQPRTADATDALARIVERELKAVDDEVEQLRSSVAAIKESPDGTILLPDGRKLDLADEITVETDDGKGTKAISLRALLTEIEKDDQALKAISTCSGRKTS